MGFIFTAGRAFFSRALGELYTVAVHTANFQYIQLICNIDSATFK